MLFVRVVESFILGEFDTFVEAQYDMRTVILIGTDHKYQRPIDGPDTQGIELFREALRIVCREHCVQAIAEEMSFEALQEKGLEESVPEQLGSELSLKHQFSDPTQEERWNLGIRQDNDIRAEHFNDGWSQEQIEGDVRARGKVVSDRIRERYWWNRIRELDTWPLLFICGADHYSSFSALLTRQGVKVIESYRDWEP